ncbi:34171_t:CDS:2 [Gigaspora margarita]|uniref:34171_t:CDS:1 n=1 Tax=Gigaspora margarita TaxID=4874 RepID=A0ABN7WF69_GIGMA|nr:34171_t:CDS:2 [Gigaspora margarita]
MPRPTSKSGKKQNTRSAKNKEVVENKDESLTESFKEELSESVKSKKRQRKPEYENISEKSVRASPASNNITDANYIQVKNIQLLPGEASHQQISNNEIIDKLENNLIQLQGQQDLTYEPQDQRYTSIHGINSTPFANFNQQMYYFLELPFVNKSEVGSSIDPSLDPSNESRKCKRPLYLNNASYMNDPLFSPTTYLISNPLFLPCSSNHVSNYHGQYGIINNFQNKNEPQQIQVKQPTMLCSSINHNKSTDDQPNDQGLFFPNETALVEWLRTREDLIYQVQKSYDGILELLLEQCKLLFLRTRNPNSKVRETLVEKIASSVDPSCKELTLLKRKTYVYFNGFRYNFNKDMASLANSLLGQTSDPTDEDVKKFVAGDVWQHKFNRFLEVTNYAEFKKSTSFKSLKIFVIESLKIHIKYLIAIRNHEKPSYQDDVLDKIKLLNRLTTHISIPTANNYNYVNELDLGNNNNED